ncbi:putative nuclease HARBI1 isoform X2 [Sitophilus oryzae]|uniref:Nuclease HARBI1 isoform X2 n=1 Tax=Sitophilus oryzae TaxID=7048 RepID=A0A6J2Y6H6_SITOR|nr:putative nuclease HARBI1 isoform X2 [Sitophilus oryzae]
MYSDEQIKAAALLGLILLRRRQNRRRRYRKKRTIWVRKWIQNRSRYGATNTLLKELREGDEAFYKNFLRLSSNDFDYLLEKITPLIQKKDTFMRKAITLAERLVVTLRYLATGDSFQSLMYLFRIPTNTLSQIIPEVCKAIYDVLKDDYLKMPNTEAEWTKIADDFNTKWNFPNCLGSLDGKHINIKAPPNSGSLYFNYKGAHSIVLMALADANYKFTYINVGSPGRDSDGGVYSNCSLADAVTNNLLNIPNERPLPGRSTAVPFVFVADDAFALQPHIMKPFAFRNQSIQERIFNYRLSRARRIIENVFGICSARFRILRRSVELVPKKMKIIVCAIAALHNFIMSRKESANMYAPQGTFDVENEDGTIIRGNWRNEENSQHFVPLERIPRGISLEAKNVRDEYKNYFCREGEVPWQRNYI